MSTVTSIRLVALVVACAFTSCSKTDNASDDSDADSDGNSDAADPGGSQPVGTEGGSAPNVTCESVPQRDETLAPGDTKSGLEACSDDSMNLVRLVTCFQHFSKAECACGDGGVWFGEFYPGATCADICDSRGGDLSEVEPCAQSLCETRVSECETDSDCSSDEACLCSASDGEHTYNSVARCRPAQCRGPQDCDGRECGVSTSRTGCGVMGMYCRTADDECHGHVDCPREQECVFQGDRWGCSDRVSCDEP